MEVKAGYKQTDMGVIPENWDVKTLHEGITLLSGNHVLAKDCNTDGAGVPYITGPADFPKGIIQHSKFTEKPTTICRANDILVTVKGSGAGTIVLSDATYCISRQLMAIRVTDWDSTFICMSLIHDSALFEAAATGLIPGLSRGDILTKKIAIPPLSEQRIIATALSDVDTLVTSLDKLIAKKRDLKQAAMQELLTGKRRLPGFDSDKGYKQTDIGLISEDWDAKTIGNDIDLLTGFPFPSIGYAKSGVRLLRGSNVKRGQTDWADGITQYWPEISDDIKQFQLREDDLVIAMDGSLVGRSYAQLKSDDLPALLLQRVARIRSTKKLDVSYLTAFIASDRWIKYADSIKTVTAIPHISPADIRNFKIPVPPTIEEQRAIASILSDMDLELAALERKRDKTKAIKQGMMQELLTGRIRLV